MASAKPILNNKSELLQLLEGIRYPSELPFVECISVTSSDPVTIAEVENDLERELAFHNQALACVVDARRNLVLAKVPFSRPEDYFAEMVKSDVHMARIRTRLIDEQASMKKSEEARKLRDQRKFGKQVQAEVLKARKAKEKEVGDKVKSLKKKRKLEDTAATFEEDFDVLVSDDEDQHKRGGGKRQRTSSGGASGGVRKPNKKREVKNARFGFGGSKRHVKSNSRESSANFDFSVKANKSAKFGGGVKKAKHDAAAGKKKGKAPRPGKSRRQHGKK
ncbi:rRNA-processing protein EBP2 [Sorochytrium milnesiophthora]